MSDTPESNIHTLPGVSLPTMGVPQKSLVEMLENLVERAKEGQLQSFIGTGFTDKGERLAAWYDTHPDTYQMLGSIAWLEHEYVHRHTKG